MLKLDKIVKNYKVADSYVPALKGVSLSFRKNEFVSILGPSGCGKTTLLNIIGGLDTYTAGDLFINGRSTKDFNDRDWDVYRNHRIGFIFQSYNLIPHQTILGNVELALTIAGISKEERIKRAKKAIDRVGLANHYHKKPNQLSGGQCQRVAIARALVNEPEILLADEPTGALDTQTSIQIMDLIKEISAERLVIMVTHNPELAQKYSTRIVKLLDGELISDSNPYSLEDEEAERLLVSNKPENDLNRYDKKNKGKEKAKMSFFTAFKLSLRNLFSKKGRTILTCIAGSIGIIGVSAVLAVSSGVRGYITSMQDDMLSGNPVEINESGYDLSSMMSGMSFNEKLDTLEIVDGKVNVSSMLGRLIQQGKNAQAMQIKNDITKDYVEYIKTIDSKYAAAIAFEYGVDLTNNIYTNFSVHGDDKNLISCSAIRSTYTSVLKQTEYAEYASYVTNLTDVFQQAPANEDYILSQYDLLYGDEIATKADEIMIVVNDNQELTDLLMAQLGYYFQDQFVNTVYYYTDKSNPGYNPSLDKNRFTYEELVGKEFYYYPNDSIYKRNTNLTSPFTYEYNKNGKEAEGKLLKVKAILKPKETISYGCLESGFFYTEALALEAIESGLKSEVVSYLNTLNLSSFISPQFGITYSYPFTAPDGTVKNDTTYVGSNNSLMDLLGSYMGNAPTPSVYTLSLRELGGIDLPSSIKIYPINFELKKGVISHLDRWNSDETITFVNSLNQTITLTSADRNEMRYSDDIELIINLINSLIDIVTTALISFTALSLVVSCFMIAIITYVSVVERVKEIGVIRSLGGRKKDVTHLFNAETFIIGLSSGIFGIIITYILQIILNVAVKANTGVYPIASLSFWQAFTMIVVAVLLTIVSGLIPARSAAKKDPVVALRTE